jgi:hypothetical protein
MSSTEDTELGEGGSYFEGILIYDSLYVPDFFLAKYIHQKDWSFRGHSGSIHHRELQTAVLWFQCHDCPFVKPDILAAFRAVERHPGFSSPAFNLQQFVLSSGLVSRSHKHSLVSQLGTRFDVRPRSNPDAAMVTPLQTRWGCVIQARP